MELSQNYIEYQLQPASQINNDDTLLFECSTQDNCKQTSNIEGESGRRFGKELMNFQENDNRAQQSLYQIRGRQPFKQQGQFQQSFIEKNIIKREMSVEIENIQTCAPQLRHAVSSNMTKDSRFQNQISSEDKENHPYFVNTGKNYMEVENVQEQSRPILNFQFEYGFLKDQAQQNPVYQHARGIFDYLLTCEERYNAQGNMADIQKDITGKMRAILIDWLVDVHLKFKLLPDTLYLTVNLIDRFIERKIVSKEELQLVGSTAMFIACKYEEIYPLELGDFVFIGDNSYTKEQILQMEGQIVESLDFELAYSSPYRFLERYCHLNESSKEEFFCAQYLIELSLVDYSMVKYNSSLQAASALYLINKLFENQNPWRNELISQSNYKTHNLRLVAKDMLQLLSKANDLQQMYLELFEDAEAFEKQRMDDLNKWYSLKLKEIADMNTNSIQNSEDSYNSTQKQKMEETNKSYEETKKYILETVQKYKKQLSSSNKNLVAVIRKFSLPPYQECAKILFYKQKLMNSLNLLL